MKRQGDLVKEKDVDKQQRSTQPPPASVSYDSSKVVGENPAKLQQAKQANGNGNGTRKKASFLSLDNGSLR